MKRLIAGLALSVVFMMMIAESLASELNTLRLDSKPLKLLNDRLRVRMPAGTVLEPRQNGIMSSPSAVEAETRAVYEKDDKKLVLMAQELFCIADDSFVERLGAWDREELKDGRTVKTTLLVDQKGYRVFQSEYAPVVTDREANLVLAAWVVNRDNMVQHVAVYANPAGARDAGMRGLCSSILKTLAPGDRPLEAKGGAQTLSELVIDLPEGYATVTDPGPDFLVHWIHKISPFSRSHPSIGIYVGRHPGYLHPRTDDAAGRKVEKIQGELMGIEATWFKYTEEGVTYREAILWSQDPGVSSIHVVISAVSEKDLEALGQVVATFQFDRTNKGFSIVHGVSLIVLLVLCGITAVFIRRRFRLHRGMC
jgi:hypothetical protein